jgi:hypothetical protein
VCRITGTDGCEAPALAYPWNTVHRKYFGGINFGFCIDGHLLSHKKMNTKRNIHKNNYDHKLTQMYSIFEPVKQVYGTQGEMEQKRE